MSKEGFKLFVKKNPNFINHVKNKEVSWQELYELYDLYGEDESAFNKYLKEDSTPKVGGKGFNDFINMTKNIDIDKMQNGVTSLQKALSLFSELFVNSGSNTNSNNGYRPRAVYKRFED